MADRRAIFLAALIWAFMTDIPHSLTSAAARPGSTAGLARALSSPWLGLAMVAAAIAIQVFGPLNGDNAWLLTVAEKVLDGARPYVDVIESNPPMAFLFYAPAILVARLAHIRVEFPVTAFVFLCAAASIALSGRVARAAEIVSSREAGFVRNAAIFALLLLPGFSFAQREHNASILVAPILVVYAARALGARVGVWDAVMAGVAAALAMAIKPHFALAVLLPLAFVMFRQRSLTALVAPEQLAALAGALVNIAIIFLTLPAFLPLAAVSLDVYAPMREPMSHLLTETWFLLNAVLLAGLLVCFGRACLSSRVAVPALASAGFVATYLIQAKGWANHALPGVEMACFAVAMAFAPVFFPASVADGDRLWARSRRYALFVFLPLLASAPILFGALLPFKGYEPHAGLTAAVLRHAPPRPKVMALSQNLDVGHPLTRVVDGEWVGRPNGIWLMVFSRALLDRGVGDEAYRARLAAYIEKDARGFREDVETRRPDVILVLEKSERVQTAMENPDIAAAMDAYERVDGAADVGVWIRKR